MKGIHPPPGPKKHHGAPQHRKPPSVPAPSPQPPGMGGKLPPMPKGPVSSGY